MRLSHSKLSCILSCPATYYLNYIQGISKKTEKSALAIGSAVHWGIEHDTEDLSEYYGTDHAYGRDEMLAESMVHGYLKHKNDIFDQILTNKDGTRLELLDENHELFITGKLKSLAHNEPHDFVGIIDLLLLTDKGFIIIDYKTSTYAPNWDNYLEQIYRYIFLLRSEFPDIPVVKIGIINIRKTGIRQKKTENYEQFLHRMKFEYDINDDQLVNYHEYLPEELEPKIVDGYIENLSKMADMAQIIDTSKCWFINFGSANGQYGKSDYWDIFYHTPDCHWLYKIRDVAYIDDGCGSYIKEESRDCLPIDMTVLDDPKVMNHYSQFKDCFKEMLLEHPDWSIQDLLAYIKSKFTTDDTLLDMYVANVYAENFLKVF